MRPRNYVQVWNYARRVGYPRSMRGAFLAWTDLIRATRLVFVAGMSVLGIVTGFRTPKHELEREMELTK